MKKTIIHINCDGKDCPYPPSMKKHSKKDIELAKWLSKNDLPFSVREWKNIVSKKKAVKNGYIGKLI